MVLRLAGYTDENVPISDKTLEIIQDKSIDDYVRSKYVIDIEWRIRNLHNKRIEVDEKTREKIYPALIKIIDDTENSSILRAEAAGALTFIGKNNEEISKYIIELLDDKDDLVKTQTIEGIYRLDDNKTKGKLLFMLKNRPQYSTKIIDVVKKRLTGEPAKTHEAIPYLLDMLKDIKDKEEFKRMTNDLQSYNDIVVLEPITKKFKELGLEKKSGRYYFKNSLLLDYLPKVKDEDKLFVLNLICDTSGGVVGDVYTPPHFDKAINTLKDYTLSPDKKIQLVALRSYGRMLDSLGSTWLKPAQEKGMSKLDDIKKILLGAKGKTNDPEIIEEIDSSLNKIEKLKSR